MLTQGAVEAFTMGPDALFSKGKNFLFIDFADASSKIDPLNKRLYIPWDLDSVFVSKRSDGDIYGTLKTKGKNAGELTQQAYQEAILNNFPERYEAIMATLLAGPLSPASLTAFLNALEVVLSADLELDPNNNIDGSIAERFDHFREWVTGRAVNIQGQL